MNDEVLFDSLRAKHPGAFEGWDGFEVTFTGRQRKDREPELLVCLFNESKTPSEAVVDLHVAFVVTSDADGGDVIRVGRTELVAEWTDLYVPGN